MAMMPNPVTKEYEYTQKPWASQSDYNIALMLQMQREIEGHWKFMHYLKTHYPEALMEWNALNKIAES